jgi:hypothetical protein
MEEGARVHHFYGSYAPSTYGSYEPRRANPSTAPRRGGLAAQQPAGGPGAAGRPPERARAVQEEAVRLAKMGGEVILVLCPCIFH